MKHYNTAKELQAKVLQYIPESRITLSDISVVLEARKTANYEEAHNTKLFKNDALSYCLLLKIIETKIKKAGN